MSADQPNSELFDMIDDSSYTTSASSFFEKQASFPCLSHPTFTQLPHNILAQVFCNLPTRDRLHLCLTCKSIFQGLIQRLYSTVIYVPVEPAALLAKNFDVSNLKSDDYTLLHAQNVARFFHCIGQRSILQFNYSDLVLRLYVADLADQSTFDLSDWRNNHCPSFSRLQSFEFPEQIDIKPLTFKEAPLLRTIYIDENFCRFAERCLGSVDFIDMANVREIFFKGRLGRNEDMLIFGLLTKHPQLIGRLTGLHFNVDSESYDRVYRRVVGFFAILRKMGLVMHNLSSLSLPMTNHSTAVIVNLISRHLYFENLQSLTLYIEDDGGVLNLVGSMNRLAAIIGHRGINMTDLSVSYRLGKEDVEKNHLRSMTLLNLMQQFSGLHRLNIDLEVGGLNLSNLLMILGTPILNNMTTLRDIRINISYPSENLIGNLIPTLEDVNSLLPHLNYIDRCGCEVCRHAYSVMIGNSPVSNGISRSIQVSSLMIVGRELDEFQQYTTRNRYRRFIKTVSCRDQGCLFDHLVNEQLNESLRNFPQLKIFEICGMVYHRTFDDGKFELMFGQGFHGLEESQLADMIDMGRILGGEFHSVGGSSR